MIVFGYDTARFDFHSCACAGLGVADLAALHDVPGPDPAWSTRLREQWWLGRLYAGAGEAMAELYVRFLREAALVHVGTVRRFQKRVCFRVQLPRGEPAPGNFHRDADWGQAREVWNLWIPFVNVAGENTLWVESAAGLGDHRPVDLAYGEALVFAGGPLSHGSVTNRTGTTRVSGDLRFLPEHVGA